MDVTEIAFDSDDAWRALGERLREAREYVGLSQEAVADLTGLHRTYVGSVERGERNVSIDNMERLARAVSTKLATLLSEAD